MYLKNRFEQPIENFRMPYTDSELPLLMCEKILSWFPDAPREFIILCIGTDRSTGDALGPLTGTFLQETKPKHLHVYGTVHDPVHAVNMQEAITIVKENHQDPYIIAIDACLGRNSSIGHIITEKAPLKPGAALNKALPAIGDMNITGVVNISGFMEHSILQNTRLSVVIDMAKQITDILGKIDQRLTYNYSPAVVISKKHPIKKWTV
ncbi:spore protease YyaC [Oceanobacillus polygoni]|uniref:Sporulation protein YyaC n=1 Tax=Oceanobacillus polygoni TaxID=1235259 RepID=A0A9X0YUJ7_9BACI|nr:spore protease YyaC [Oceanobacillus polygoni]MBP2078607.1 putative sporulation protein YyaC [Oceanobacillus polygoni]